MGGITSQELASVAFRDRNWTWDDVVNDPVLSRLPFQIELDKYGRLLMSPAANWYHGKIQATLAGWLRQRMGGATVTEVAIETDEGTFEPDVVWASNEFWNRQDRERSDLPEAPPLVVEVLSKSNTEAEMRNKTDAYLASGAVEVWQVSQDGVTRFFGKTGEVARSAIADCDAAEVKAAIEA